MLLMRYVQFEQKTIIAEVKTFRNKINSSCETILHIVIDLERDTLKIDDIDIHLKRLVERGKKEVITVIKRESTVQLPAIIVFVRIERISLATLSISESKICFFWGTISGSCFCGFFLPQPNTIIKSYNSE